MSSEIKIDEPGAGEWVMERAVGYFNPARDHVISVHYGSEILGGFVLNNYLGRTAEIHMESVDPSAASRELLWMVFHYAFEQLGCRKLLALVPSNNYKAMELNLRAGWMIEAILRDVFDDKHMVILSMTKDQCPWLDYTPQRWRPAGGDDGEGRPPNDPV